MKNFRNYLTQLELSFYNSHQLIHINSESYKGLQHFAG